MQSVSAVAHYGQPLAPALDTLSRIRQPRIPCCFGMAYDTPKSNRERGSAACSRLTRGVGGEACVSLSPEIAAGALALDPR